MSNQALSLSKHSASLNLVFQNLLLSVVRLPFWNSTFLEKPREMTIGWYWMLDDFWMILDGRPATNWCSWYQISISIMTITTTGGAAGATRPASTACPVAGLSGRLEKSAPFMNRLAQQPKMLILTCLTLPVINYMMYYGYWFNLTFIYTSDNMILALPGDVP